MKTKRVLGVAVLTTIAAVVLAGCVSPIGPSLIPPITGSSYLLYPTDVETQHARFVLCSVAGGPVTLHVHVPGATTNTEMTVGSELGPSLFGDVRGQGEVGVDNDFTSSIDLAPGECSSTQIEVTEEFHDVAPQFTYTVWW